MSKSVEYVKSLHSSHMNVVPSEIKTDYIFSKKPHGMVEYNSQLLPSTGKPLLPHNLHYTQVISSKNSVSSSTISAGGFVDFEINNNNWYECLEKVYVEMLITNNDSVNNITLSSVFDIIEKVEVYWNSSESSKLTITGQQLLHLYIMGLTPEQKTINKLITNLDSSTYSPNAAIAASGTATYMCEIPSFWTNILFPLAAVKTLNIRIYFNQNCKTAGTGVIADALLTRCQLLVMYNHISRAEAETLKRAYTSYGVKLYCTEFVSETYNATLATSSSYSYNLQSVKGLTSELEIFVRPSSNTGANRYISYDYLDSIRLLAEDGSDVLANSNINTTWLNSLNFSDNYNSDVNTVSTRTRYLIPFCHGGHTSMVHNNGKAAGFFALNDNRIEFTTKSSGPSGSYRIEIVAPVVRQIDVLPNKEVNIIKY